jgi:hypothetical protein
VSVSSSGAAVSVSPSGVSLAASFSPNSNEISQASTASGLSPVADEVGNETQPRRASRVPRANDQAQGAGDCSKRLAPHLMGNGLHTDGNSDRGSGKSAKRGIHSSFTKKAAMVMMNF